jgi:hypothetical protein
MRALLPLLGRSLLMLALCGAALGCGDDDDDDDDDPIAGTGGKGGGGSGKGGTGGTGGAKAPTKAECVDSFTEATKLTDACAECACDENLAMVAACGKPCWDLMVCANTKCADVLMDEAKLMACVAGEDGMCNPEVAAAGPGGMIVASMTVGPIIQGPECGAICFPPVIPTDDASVDEDDGGVDAGN